MNRKYIPHGEDYRSPIFDTPATNSYLSHQQMENHAVARLRCSLIAGTHLCLMRVIGMLRAETPVLKSGALVQDDEGHNGWQAAHALPCGLICGDKPIHEIPAALKMQQLVAKPYSYTNVVPKAANAADYRVEVFRGRGLTAAFRQFANRLIAIPPGEDKRLDRNLLQAVYAQLFEDYVDAFAAVIASRPEQQIQGKSTGPGGTVIDPETFASTKEQDHEEDVRTALRLQLKAMEGLQGSGDSSGKGYSSLLVDDVETQFRRTYSETIGSSV